MTETPKPESENFVRELIERCLELVESKGESALQEFLDSHPREAVEIKERLAVLRAAGLDRGLTVGDEIPDTEPPSQLGEFELKERGHVSIQVYNVAGQLIKTLVNETRNAGAHTDIRWDGSNNAGQAVGSGVYFYKMVAVDFNMTKKMVLLK